MSDNLACARARIATDWLAGYDPGDGQGVVGEQATDPAAMFTQPVVVDAFTAGADQAEDEFAIERAVGQRQLDDATILIRAAAALFEQYADHHRARADVARDAGRLEDERASLRKAEVNLSILLRLKEWLVGDNPADLLRNVAAGMVDGVTITGVDHDAFDAARRRLGESNVRPVTEGPLSDFALVGGLMDALDGDAAALSLATAAVFRLQTPDPRFNPREPVRVNGYLYHPATEAL